LDIALFLVGGRGGFSGWHVGGPLKTPFDLRSFPPDPGTIRLARGRLFV
jgi:hypothetical protein